MTQNKTRLSFEKISRQLTALKVRHDQGEPVYAIMAAHIETAPIVALSQDEIDADDFEVSV